MTPKDCRSCPIPADHRKVAQRRSEHLLLQPVITRQDEAQRRRQQQQREQRHEPVVGQQCRQAGTEVVEVLGGHREREARRVVLSLKPVQAFRDRHIQHLTAHRPAGRPAGSESSRQGHHTSGPGRAR
jgi:hypothetical protein